jgi:hypothetical protein
LVQKNMVNDRERKILIIETSSPTALPQEEFKGTLVHDLPVKVDGWDRGISILASLATDERTREHTYIIATKRDQKVKEIALEWRKGVLKNEDPSKILSGKIDIWYRNLGRTLVKINDLKSIEADEFKKKLFDYLSSTSNTPNGVTNSDKQLDEFFKEKNISSIDEYYRMLSERIGFTCKYRLEKHFIVTQTEENLGEIGFNLNYFLTSNAMVREYPEIAIELIRWLEFAVNDSTL